MHVIAGLKLHFFFIAKLSDTSVLLSNAVLTFDAKRLLNRFLFCITFCEGIKRLDMETMIHTSQPTIGNTRDPENQLKAILIPLEYQIDCLEEV